MNKVFGIPNCDTVKKCRQWLQEADIDFEFHDFRKEGLSKTQVSQWLEVLGRDTLVNKRSTSWKALPQSVRDNFDDQAALAAILESPTLIKRPLLEHNGELHVGFKPAQYQTIFNK